MEKLAKLAARSADLRDASIAKTAGLFDAGVAAAKGIGSFAKSNPLSALTVGMTAAVAPSAVKGSYQKSKAGFNHAARQAMQGPTPGV